MTIGSGTTSIGGYAFSGCTNLPIIDNIRYADTFAIEAVDETLTEYIFKSGTKWIGDFSFDGCFSLTSITIPNGVISIGVAAFQWCESLTNITIPDSVTSIGDNAFCKCSGATSLSIGSGVTSIGNDAFTSCSGLTNITSLATIAPTIQYDTFQNIKTNGTLTVPIGSSGYDVWMGTGDYYLGKYNWTKVEQ